VASDTAGLEWALDQARAQQDRHGCKKLAALEPPPFSLRDVRVQRHYIRKYGGTFHQPRSLFALLLEALEPSEVSWLDLIDFFRGGRFSLAAFWPWLRSFDANQAYPRVALPAYLLLGRHDHHVSSELAAEYFARLRAPHKELIWFENSAHAVPFEEPERFNAEILRIARDLAVLPPL
jgi:pimeloyl-ACP methyl ester carboxylesterase